MMRGYTLPVSFVGRVVKPGSVRDALVEYVDMVLTFVDIIEESRRQK